MSNVDNQDERRRFSRVPFEAAVTLKNPNGSWTGKLKDISLKGMLVTRPQNWTAQSGDEVFVEIHPPEEVFSISMEAVVAHSQLDKIGLHCVHIDLDSISHLRRLIELNLGDSEILHRELSVMGA